MITLNTDSSQSSFPSLSSRRKISRFPEKVSRYSDKELAAYGFTFLMASIVFLNIIDVRKDLPLGSSINDGGVPILV